MPALPQGQDPNGEIPGGEVGPELSGIGARQDRSLHPGVDRRAQQADRPGLRVGRAGHQRRPGRSPASSAARTTRTSGSSPPRASRSTSPRTRSRIASAGPRPCPPTWRQKLSKPELRDLVEFLASLKTPPKTPESARGTPRIQHGSCVRGACGDRQGRPPKGTSPIPAMYRAPRRARAPLRRGRGGDPGVCQMGRWNARDAPAPVPASPDRHVLCSRRASLDRGGPAPA